MILLSLLNVAYHISEVGVFTKQFSKSIDFIFSFPSKTGTETWAYFPSTNGFMESDKKLDNLYKDPIKLQITSDSYQSEISFYVFRISSSCTHLDFIINGATTIQSYRYTTTSSAPQKVCMVFLSNEQLTYKFAIDANTRDPTMNVYSKLDMDGSYNQYYNYWVTPNKGQVTSSGFILVFNPTDSGQTAGVTEIIGSTSITPEIFHPDIKKSVFVASKSMHTNVLVFQRYGNQEINIQKNNATKLYFRRFSYAVFIDPDTDINAHAETGEVYGDLLGNTKIAALYFATDGSLKLTYNGQKESQSLKFITFFNVSSSCYEVITLVKSNNYRIKMLPSNGYYCVYSALYDGNIELKFDSYTADTWKPDGSSGQLAARMSSSFFSKLWVGDRSEKYIISQTDYIAKNTLTIRNAEQEYLAYFIDGIEGFKNMNTDKSDYYGMETWKIVLIVIAVIILLVGICMCTIVGYFLCCEGKCNKQKQDAPSVSQSSIIPPYESPPAEPYKPQTYQQQYEQPYDQPYNQPYIAPYQPPAPDSTKYDLIP